MKRNRFGEKQGSGDQVPVKDLVDKTIDKLGKGNKKALRAAYVQTIWEQVAPEEVLEHTDNVFLFMKDGKREMVIYVDSPIWAAELTACKDRFRMYVEQRMGEGPIDTLRFQASSMAYKKKTFKKREAEDAKTRADVGEVPLTNDEKNKIDEQTDSIEDEDLRNALRQAWIKSKEWQKWTDQKTSMGERKTKTD